MALEARNLFAFQANILWEHVSLDKRVRIFQPEGSKPEARVSQGSRAEGLLQDSVMAQNNPPRTAFAGVANLVEPDTGGAPSLADHSFQRQSRWSRGVCRERF